MKTHLSRHDIVFREQTAGYRDALPFGNGKFGGLTYQPSCWEWVVNKLDVDVDLYKDYRRDKDPSVFMCEQRRVEVSPPFSKILDALRRRDKPALAKLAAAWVAKLHKHRALRLERKERPHGNGENVVPAFLRLYPSSPANVSFEQRLDLHAGEIEAHCKDPTGAEYTLKTICDPDNDVFMIRAEARGKARPFQRIVLHRPPHALLAGKAHRFGSSRDCIWVDYEFANHFRYVVLARIVGARLNVSKNATEIAAGLEGPTGAITVFVTCATCLETDDPLALCRRLAASADGLDLETRNRAKWADYWRRSAIAIPDEFMENLYYVQQYVTACTDGRGMRATYKACGEYGLWPHTDSILWMNRVYGDETCKYYQHFLSSNRLEHFQAFVDMIWAFLPMARTRARKIYGLPGACFDNQFHCISPWYCVALWDYFAYSQDLGYLRRKAYPIMREVGTFYARFLRKGKDGRYFLFPSVAPEYAPALKGLPGQMGFSGYCKNLTVDLAFLKHLFKHLIVAARLLGEDAGNVPKWREILAHFPEYPTGQTKHGATLFDADESDSPLTSQHPNTIAPIYPAREFHFSGSEKNVTLAKASVRNHWENTSLRFEFTSWFIIAMIRMGLADEAEDILQKWVIDLETDPSGFMGRQIGTYYIALENLRYGLQPGNPPCILAGYGLIGAVNEMLVQEQDNTLYLFPAIPSAWQNAAFRDLRIPGAFCVSACYHHGVVGEAAITAEKGGTLRVRLPWQTRRIQVECAGKPFPYEAQAGIITLHFAAGQTVVLRPGPSHACPQWQATPTYQPKEKITAQGHRLFLGRDRRSRIIEAVDRFCFPSMGNVREIGTVLGGPEWRRYQEKPQNLYYKFDFGAGRKTDYKTAFNSPRDGDVPFNPVTSKSRYDALKRYGWAEPNDLAVAFCGGADPLTQTALASRKANVFRFDLNDGQYNFLLLHGGGKKIRTRIAFPRLNAAYCFDAFDGSVGIEGFGVEVRRDQPVKMVLSTDAGYKWQIHALLVKKVW